MRATSIHLYHPTLAYDRENAYCGSWHVPCPDDDPRAADLEAVGAGRFLDEDGVPCRAFFFADEIEDMLARAERETECIAEIDEDWPVGRSAATQQIRADFDRFGRLIESSKNWVGGDTQIAMNGLISLAAELVAYAETNGAGRRFDLDLEAARQEAAATREP